MSSEKTDSPVETDTVGEGAAVDVVDAEETEAAEPETADTEVAGPDRGALARALSWCGRRWVALVIAVGLVASAGAAGGVYWWMYRPDQLTNAAAQQQAKDAAAQGTVALLTYAPDTLDKDLASAKSHLTGEFLKYYSQFTDQIVAPAARQKGVKTEATVARAAVSEMHPDQAVVLVFVNQVTTSKDRPDPALATSSVMVTLTKSDGRWLISEFNPV
ncbi:twin-arginine translocation pathway signal [Mycolicibacterium sp. CH28]|uniref:twin-arginine translocation pathway signal n=1 Tax=Mycolicibacterium sp. CH28 TaxID=2512237 RepID=UPI001386BEAC|nr:twin-arginine translocation pathway signal [Mycolicibacterium sp. CH28]